MSIQKWISERIDFSPVQNFINKKEVPIHKHSMWYYLGGLALFFFIIQVGTGILLLLYYRPSSGEAYESVKFIMNDVHFGWLIRSMHSWGANLFIGILFVHMFSTFFLKAYRKPRELTWVTGVILFFIALAFGFSGYLLPWDELAFFATKVGTEITGTIPLIGGFLLKFLRGGEEISGATLTRFYGFHVAILPALMTLFLVIHLLLIQIQGMSIPIGYENKIKKRVKFFGEFIWHDAMIWMIGLAIWVFLATYSPWGLGPKADPFAPAPAGIRPEWYFVYMFETLKLIPGHVWLFEGEVLGVLAFGVLFFLILIVPFIDKKASLNQKSRGFTLAGAIILVYMIIMTLVSYIN